MIKLEGQEPGPLTSINIESLRPTGFVKNKQCVLEKRRFSKAYFLFKDFSRELASPEIRIVLRDDVSPEVMVISLFLTAKYFDKNSMMALLAFPFSGTAAIFSRAHSSF